MIINKWKLYVCSIVYFYGIGSIFFISRDMITHKINIPGIVCIGMLIGILFIFTKFNTLAGSFRRNGKRKGGGN